MKEKKWVLLFIAMFIVSIVGIAVMVIVVDPYFHYHKPLKGMSYSLKEEAYVNDGIVKHFEYDSIIAGTSMTLGFKVKEANEIFGGQFVRLTSQGEGFRKINDCLVTAVESNPDLKLIIRGLDPMWFIVDKDWLGYEEYPEYLYDDNIWNDVNYIYNKEILERDVIPQIVRTIKGEKPDNFDNYGRPKVENQREVMLHKYERPELEIKVVDETETKEFFRMLEENIEQNVVTIINDNPNIEFYIFFPPYSICWWDSLNQNGVDVLKRRIDMEKYVIEQLLQYENVKLYSFFNNFDLVCDLEYYDDVVHYTDEVSSKIMKWMEEGKYQLTTENYQKYLDDITEFYCNYDYDSLFIEQ